MPFYDNPVFWIALCVVIFGLIITMIIFSKKKSRKISGYFLLAAPNSEKKKTVSLIELDREQKRQIKEFSANKQATNEQWAELWKSLRLFANDTFDWKPTIKYHFKQNGVYLIQVNGQGTHIKLDTETPCPILQKVKKNF